MRTVYATPGRALDIGRYPENDTVKVVFDVKCWRKQYPAGSIALLHQRPGDDGAQPVAGLTVGSKDAEWLVSNADVLTAGEGIATLILVNGGQVELSESWKTVIGEPVTEESETPPEPIESYMTAVIEAVESYDAMTAEAEEGDTADSEIDRTGDHPVLKLTLPRGREGEPGDDGFSPIVTVTEITGGHRVTITDATGPHVFDVMDGQGGGGGGAVDSVNGKTGVVVLNANDVGALPASTPIPPAVTVDSALSDSSVNPVQNKIIKAALDSQSETIVNLPSTDDSTASGSDLDVSDADGNVLVRMKNGQIQTKNFDSAKAPNVKDSIEQGPDLDVSDENGNVILRLRNGHIETKKFTSEKIEDRTTYLTVKSSGGDFSTLRGAIDFINTQGDADPDVHPYVIQIYPGTYNVMDDYTDEEINTADVQDYHYGFVGPLLDDGVSLIGMGDRDTVVLYGTLDPSDYVARVRGNISTLNTRGNVTLENLTVIAENLRYCVHDDFSYPSTKGQYRRVVKNCKFIGKNLSHTPACTWGGGMSGKGENATYENCDFGTDYGHHFDASQSCHITFKNCRGRKIRLAEPSGSIHHYVTIENSDFEMISLMRSSGITEQHIHIEANGCENTYVSSNDGDIIITGSVSKSEKGNASIPVGTMVRRKSSFGNGYESTNDPDVADGIVVANDDYYTYVQRTGYINTRILEMTGFSLGDYITIDSNNKLATGGTASNAVGVVSFISQDSDALDQGIGFIKLLIGGMK